MFVQVSLLTLTILQVALCAPLQNEKIEPVGLGSVCVHITHGNWQNKSPILLLHGLTASSSSWDAVQDVLVDLTDRRVCAVDLRNHGNSGWSNETGIDAMAADIGNYLDSEKVKKVNLIGHSLGGRIAIYFALNNPERVESLVVEDMTPGNINQAATTSIQSFAKLLLELIKPVSEVSTEEEARKIVLDFLNKKRVELGLDDVVQETDLNLKFNCENGKCQFQINPYLLQKVAEDPNSLMIESKGLYKGPTLFIYGKASPFHVNKDEKIILELFPNAKLVGVDGAGHRIHGKHREFNDEVIKFLSSI